MIRIVLFFLLILTPLLAAAQNNPEDVDKEAFYSAFSSSDKGSIDLQLKRLDGQHSRLAKAYAGALLMKKADIVKGPKEKLSTFKDGKELLDGAISEDPDNAEFRFLRLVIQEQAPAILNYNDKKGEDARQVVESFSEFPDVVKDFVKDYAQNSDSLKADSFD